MTDTASYLKRNKLKTAWKIKQSINPIYTGGKICLSQDGLALYTTLEQDVIGTDVRTGEELCRINGDSDITSICLMPCQSTENATLMVARRSFGLHFHTVPDGMQIKLVARAHEAPIITTSADPSGNLFATGSSDGIVKLWDSQAAHCTHVFKGHGGVISAFAWDLSIKTDPRLVSAADDCRIRIWSLTKRKCLEVLEGHSSVVRGLAVSTNGNLLISGGRDRLVNVWSLSNDQPAKLKATIPVAETLECCGLIKSADKGKGKLKEGETIFTGGDRGTIRLWSLQTGQLLSESKTPLPEITDLIYLPHVDSLVSVAIDQNIIFHSIPDLKSTKHLIGYNDEIIDCLFLSSINVEDTLAVATNSEQLRLYELDKDQGFPNSRLLTGHSDVVLCLAKSANGDLLMTGSKDKTAKLWRHIDGEWQCIATCTGHLESVGAVAISKLSTTFAITASQDRNIKIWDLTKGPSSMLTQKIHEKDINALDIAPNDQLFLSGSQDKSAKLFAINTSKGTTAIELRGILNGHKRGIWSVKFSSHEQIAATASGDKTIKLWDINSFACLKTFEGHTNSVLRVDFMTQSLQLVSCASDGLVKVWNIKDEESVATLDNHEEKIWALAISKDEQNIVSGAADSVVTFWQDVTKEQEEEKIAKEEERVIQNQDYENFVVAQDYKSAILLALHMDNPRRLLGLFKAIASSNEKDPESATGSFAVDKALTQLLPDDLLRLLIHVRDWNTSIKTADIAQNVLHVILCNYTASQLLSLGSPPSTDVQHNGQDNRDKVFTDEAIKTRKKVSAAIGEVVEGLLPYTERHYNRADRFESSESFILDYTLVQMQGVAMHLD